MTITIQRIPHDAEHTRELFGWIGEACASATVHKELGAPITSQEGDIWLLALDGEALLGFCAVHRLKSRKAAKMHALYVFDPAKALRVETALRKAAVKEASALGAAEISTTDYERRVKAYAHDGWQVSAERGQYRVYSKEVA